MFQTICTRSNLTVDIRNPFLTVPLIFTAVQSLLTSKLIAIKLYTFNTVILNFTLAALYSKNINNF